MFVRNSYLKTSSSCLYALPLEAHHKTLCWDVQNSKLTYYCWRMPDFISTLGTYTPYFSLLRAEREYQSTRLCYFILASTEPHTLLTPNIIIKNRLKPFIYRQSQEVIVKQYIVKNISTSHELCCIKEYSLKRENQSEGVKEWKRKH